MSIVDQVKQNLLFYNLWTDVSEVQLTNDILLQGKPKEKLLNDEEINNHEIVLPINLSTKLTVSKLDSLFKELEVKLSTRPKRIVVGIINEDSTIVYYFIHDGVYKPKKN